MVYTGADPQLTTTDLISRWYDPKGTETESLNSSSSENEGSNDSNNIQESGDSPDSDEITALNERTKSMQIAYLQNVMIGMHDAQTRTLTQELEFIKTLPEKLEISSYFLNHKSCLHYVCTKAGKLCSHGINLRDDLRLFEIDTIEDLHAALCELGMAVYAIKLAIQKAQDFLELSVLRNKKNDDFWISLQEAIHKKLDSLLEGEDPSIAHSISKLLVDYWQVKNPHVEHLPHFLKKQIRSMPHSAIDYITRLKAPMILEECVIILSRQLNTIPFSECRFNAMATCIEQTRNHLRMNEKSVIFLFKKILEDGCIGTGFELFNYYVKKLHSEGDMTIQEALKDAAIRASKHIKEKGQDKSFDL